MSSIGEIASKVSYWANVEGLYLASRQSETSRNLKELESSITDLYRVMLEWKVTMICEEGFLGTMSHSKLPKYYSLLKGRIIKSHSNELNWCKLTKSFELCCEICEKRLNTLKERNAKQTEILQWISDFDPRSSHEDTLQRTEVNTKYQHCGQWLLDRPEFQEWSSKTPSRSHRVLWLCGTAGTGKTTLM